MTKNEKLEMIRRMQNVATANQNLGKARMEKAGLDKSSKVEDLIGNWSDLCSTTPEAYSRVKSGWVKPTHHRMGRNSGKTISYFI